jgi:Leucine-rich repeat (LRR) protein
MTIAERLDPKHTIAAIHAADAQTVFDRLRSEWGTTRLHPSVREYLEATAAISLVKGPLRIRGFGSIELTPVDCGELFGVLAGTVFPAVRVGQAERTDFWLMLESGKVVSLDHPASLRAEAAECKSDSLAAFVKDLVARGSVLDIAGLLELQTALHDAFGDEEPARGTRWVRILAELFGGPAKLRRLAGSPALEFLAPVDTAVLDDIAAAERRWAKLAKQPDKVTELDLGAAHLLAVPPLDAFPKLVKLSLAANPELGLDGIRSAAASVPALSRLDVSDCGLSAEDLDALRSALPRCRVVCGDASGLDAIAAALRHPATATRLDLSDLDLEALPPAVVDLERLAHLDLSGNPRLDLAGAFALLAELPSLRSLVLQRCRLQHLPEEITRLHALEELDLAGGTWGDNNAVAVDEALALAARLPKLTRLVLDTNRVMQPRWPAILAALGKLPPLRHLGMGNWITKENAGARFAADLLRAVGAMTSLESANLAGLAIERIEPALPLRRVDLSRNPIKSLAPAALPAIEELVASSSELGSLEGLEEARALRVLDLAGARSAAFALPEWLGELTALERLRLVELAFETVPESIGDLAQLGWLELASPLLAALPAELGRLAALDTLIVGSALAGCPKLAALPETIEGCARLRTLVLRQTGVARLPAALVGCRELSRVEVGDVAPGAVEPTLALLAQLPRLERLTLHGLDRVPPSLAACQALREVSLRGALASYAEAADAIGSLPELRRVDLAFYELTRLPASIVEKESLEALCYEAPKAPSQCLDLRLLASQLAALPNLRELDLTDVASRYEELPVEIGELARLESLTLRLVSFAKLPTSLGKLHNLRTLHLDRCSGIKAGEKKRIQKLLPDCRIEMTDW